MKLKYKHLLLSFLLCSSTSLLWAQTVPQPSYTLDTIETGAPKTYIARDYVSMKSGFAYRASKDSRFNAKIDAGLLFPPTDKTYALPNGTITTDPTRGAVVGSIPGQFGVSPTGAATYNIPIECPTGINGMQPNISVGFNSQAGYGDLGTGWNISGVSAITRGGNSLYFDNNTKGIKFDNSDALYLDGQRLIYLSGGSGHLTSGAIYGTEVENYSKITYNGSSFILTTIDGKILEYGVTDDSKLTNSTCVNSVNGTTGEITPCSDTRVLAWKINKVTDTYGNVMTYTYGMPPHYKFGLLLPAYDKGKYLSKIEYAGQSIEFIYDYLLPVSKKSYIKDFLISQTKLLTSIISKSGGTILKTYGLNYKSSTDDRLNSVSLKASDNTTVNSTVISWGQEGTLQYVLLGSATDQNLNTQNPGMASMQFADINGDGYSDRIEMWSGNSGESGHIITYIFDNTNKTFQNSTSAIIYFPYHNYKKYQPQFITSDINGDGKAEVVFLNYKSIYAYKYNSQTNSFVAAFSDNSIAKSTEMIFDTYSENNKIRLMNSDVNDDGINDVILAYGYDDEEFGAGLFYGTRSGLLHSTDYFKSGLNAFKYLEAGDFNADNKIDIYGSRYSSSASSIDDEKSFIRFKTNYSCFENSNNEYRNSGDLNGDGLTDILVLDKDEKKWYAYINNGNFNLSKTPLTVTRNGALYNLPFFTPDDNHDNKTYFMDFDGDGLLDIVSAIHYIGYYNPNPVILNSLRFFKNKGNFVFDWVNSYEQLPGKISNLNTITDINGDGIADFVVAVNENSTSTPTPYKFYAITMPQANKRNVVMSIKNGMSQTVNLSYNYSSDYEVYKNSEATAKIRPLRSPKLLVNSITEPNGSVTTYNFEKPKYHTEGKGFLGFTTVTSTTDHQNSKSVSNYSFNEQYYYSELEKQSVSTVNGADTISVSTLTNDVKVIDSVRKRFIPIVTEQVSTNVLNGITQKVSTDYSNYPNSISQSETKGGITTTTVTTFTGASGKIPYLPFNITVTNNLNGDTQKHISAFKYLFDIANNKPYTIIGKTEIVDTGDINQVTTTYSNYDSWGHPQMVSISANDKIRTSSLSYTSTRSTTGRFLQSETDIFGETTNYNWNEITGLLDSKTDVRNRTINYKYDKFGQLIETSYPNGIRNVNTMQWSGDSDVAGSQYYSYSQVSGNAPLIVWYDKLGREIQRDTYRLNNKKVCVSTEYYTTRDNIGKLHRISEPYFEGDTKTWATVYNTYDAFGRVKLTTSPVGQTTINYDRLSTTITTPTGTKTTTINNSGLIENVSINKKTVSYTYWPSGLIKTATPEGGSAVSTFYNLQGNRTKIVDPDAGTIRNEYNGFGEMIKQVQLTNAGQDSTITINNYDPQTGLITSNNQNNVVTSYNYDINIGYKTRIKSIEIDQHHKQTFSYDAYDKIINIKEEIFENGTGYKEFNKTNEYDALGRLKKEKFASGYYTINSYDNYSHLIEVKDAEGRSIWKINDRNALGQATSVLKGNKETIYTYDPVNHQNTSISASGIIDYSYGYHPDNNLQWRKDNLTNQREDFIFDDQKRLTNWDVTNNDVITNYSLSFDTNGNIKTKSDLGSLNLFYGLKGRPHALDSINGVPTVFPAANLNVAYTDFKKIKTISEGNKFYELTYGVDEQRRISICKVNGQTKQTRYYLGDYEEEHNADGNIRKIHYLSGAIYIDNSKYNDSLYYVYTDNQGSVIALTDDAGNVKRRFAYDPWGKRRNPQNWNLTDDLAGLIINRGYTGHEHLDAFGIINMNGRVYDPLTAQFFSPDPFIQAPDNWVNYNRYGYVFGNPLSYTDPSGYVSKINQFFRENLKPVVTTIASIAVGAGVFILTGGVGAPLATQAVLGMVAATASSTTSAVLGTALNGGGFGDCFLAGTKGAIFGGMSAMATSGVGDIFGGVGSIAKHKFDILNEIGRAGAHSATQGAIATLRGGDFWQGAASGALSSIGSSIGGGYGVTDFWGTVTISSVSGGIGAYIGGASSAEDILFGMATGAIVGALNHYTHKVVFLKSRTSRMRAMEYMQRQSKTSIPGASKTHEVVAAALTDGSIVVMPEKGNTELKCKFEIKEINGKVYVEVGGVNREVAYIIHTHPGRVYISISTHDPIGVSQDDKDMGILSRANMYYIMGNQMYSVDVTSELSIKYPTLITP